MSIFQTESDNADNCQWYSIKCLLFQVHNIPDSKNYSTHSTGSIIKI